MNAPQEPKLPAKGQFLVYPSEDGRVKIEVRLANDTVWLTQQHMANPFQTSKQNVGQHLKNIFEEGELAEDSVVKSFFTTAADGKDYRTSFYNLDAIMRDWIAKLNAFLTVNERAIGGAPQPQANAVVLISASLPVPAPSLGQEFNRLIQPMIDEAELLAVKIQNLRRTRDLLLPRLLSGQVNLEKN